MGCPCSINENGLFDYVIFNQDLDEALQRLASIARRALAGQVLLTHCRKLSSYRLYTIPQDML